MRFTTAHRTRPPPPQQRGHAGVPGPVEVPDAGDAGALGVGGGGRAGVFLNQLHELLLGGPDHLVLLLAALCRAVASAGRQTARHNYHKASACTGCPENTEVLESATCLPS